MGLINILKRDEPITYFSEGRIKLTKQNFVHFKVDNGDEKVVTFGKFKKRIHLYSEETSYSFVKELISIEYRAMINARKGGLAKRNLI